MRLLTLVTPGLIFLALVAGLAALPFAMAYDAVAAELFALMQAVAIPVPDALRTVSWSGLERVFMSAGRSLLFVAVTLIPAICIGQLLGAMATLSGQAGARCCAWVLGALRLLPLALLAALAMAAIAEAGLLYGSPATPVSVLVLILAGFGALRIAEALCRTACCVESAAFGYAAREAGAGSGYLLRHHVWPLALPQMALAAGWTAAGIFIAETLVSFLGLGLPAEAGTLGIYLAERILGGWQPDVPGVAALALTSLIPLGLLDATRRASRGDLA